MKNRNRIQELVVLAGFLVFLFLFSGKSFGPALDAAATKHVKIPEPTTSVAIAPATSLKAPSLPPVLKTNFDLQAFPVNIHVENKKTEHFLSHLQRCSRLVKPGLGSRFYYRLFTLSGELPA